MRKCHGQGLSLRYPAFVEAMATVAVVRSQGACRPVGRRTRRPGLAQVVPDPTREPTQ